MDLKYLDRPDVLKNPRSPGGEGLFVYVKPKETLNKIQSTTTTVMIHEPLQGNESPQIAVGFADGHVEYLPRAEAEKQVNALRK